MWPLTTTVDCAGLEFNGGDYTAHNKVNLILFYSGLHPLSNLPATFEAALDSQAR